MTLEWIAGCTFEVPCTIEIEHSAESLHAHVDLDGIDVLPGDRVKVHAAPKTPPFGQRIVCRSRATIMRAGLAGRIGARLRGYLDLTDLYEVGFDGSAT